ncbi:DUF1653 domain-containing protein [Glaciecola petra]|uniref:DUF1653 domain-containing protein n=1 Tax=Glaciecola petra TaxID=3075602 RepID=A0ABU2ZV74_9ALTE|nr:DUF1653 domain-containing protein [Aestuariibacter sp. P117]MDT0596549.1 DUF1653 domain-containing protein [Aestuariibacter sp. P117]
MFKKGLYRHFKGGKYEVIDVVKHSEDESTLVLYRPLYGEKTLWVRPYDMFFEKVELESGTVERFSFVSTTL